MISVSAVLTHHELVSQVNSSHLWFILPMQFIVILRWVTSLSLYDIIPVIYCDKDTRAVKSLWRGKCFYLNPVTCAIPVALGDWADDWFRFLCWDEECFTLCGLKWAAKAKINLIMAFRFPSTISGIYKIYRVVVRITKHGEDAQQQCYTCVYFNSFSFIYFEWKSLL